MGSKASFWEAHLAAWQTSGQSQTAYCREHGLLTQSFAYWRRKAMAADQPARVVPISVVPRLHAPITLHHANGWALSVSSDVDPASVMPWLRAVASC